MNRLGESCKGVVDEWAWWQVQCHWTVPVSDTHPHHDDDEHLRKSGVKAFDLKRVAPLGPVLPATQCRIRTRSLIRGLQKAYCSGSALGFGDR